jgi:hypothetical protein
MMSAIETAVPSGLISEYVSVVLNELFSRETQMGKVWNAYEDASRAKT